MKTPLFFCLVLLFFFIPNIAIAGSVQVNTIEVVAQYWIENNAIFKKAKQKHPNIHFKIQSIQKIILDGEEFPAYAVRLKPVGYLVISADDLLHPVISFSDSSNLDFSLSNTNGFRKLLKSDLGAAKNVLLSSKELAAKQIKTKTKTKTKNQIKWKKYISKVDSEQMASFDEPSLAYDMPPESIIVIDELLETRWNQNQHYNALTPESTAVSDYYDGHVPTGCVSTAYAQVMKFHNWPWYGNGSYAYSDNSGGTQGDHSASFVDEYDWENMQDSYVPFGDEPSVAVAAVSELIYEVGVATEMDYEADGSSASTIEMLSKLATHFLYQKGSVVDASGPEMINAIITEIGMLNPCVVSVPGHAIVADGHSTEGDDNYFHINYGWGGANNGWYLLNGVPGGGIVQVNVGSYPRAVPLIQSTEPVAETFTISWKFPDYYPSVESIRLFEGSMHYYDLVQDTADDFSSFEPSEAGSDLWVIDAGQFHWELDSVHSYGSIMFNRPVVPSASTVLSFDLKSILIDEVVTLEISVDGGETWEELRAWTNTGWNNNTDFYQFDLSAYVETEVLIRFNAAYKSGGYYPEGGIWIDNVSLSNCQIVDFEEKTNNFISNLTTQSIEISELASGTTYYRLQVLSDGRWSEKSPTVTSVFTQTELDFWTVHAVDSSGTIDWLAVDHSPLSHASYIRFNNQYYYVYSSATNSPLSEGGEDYTYATLLACNQLTGEPAPGPYDQDGPQWADLIGLQGGSIETFSSWQDITDLQIIITLREGWNLISVPLNNLWYVGDTPPEMDTQNGQTTVTITNINELFNSIDGQYDLLRGFDTEGAKTYDPDIPENLNSLDYLAGGYGYWIKMNQSGTLCLTGQAPHASDSLQLHTGWNLIGHWGGDEKAVANSAEPSTYVAETPIGDDLNTIIDSVELVRGFDAEGAKTYDPAIDENLNTLHALKAGQGYWIKLNQDEVINFGH